MQENSSQCSPDSPLNWNAERQAEELIKARSFELQRVVILEQSPGGDPQIHPFQFFDLEYDATDEEVTEAFRKVCSSFPADSSFQSTNHELWEIYNRLRRYALQARETLQNLELRQSATELAREKYPDCLLELPPDTDFLQRDKLAAVANALFPEGKSPQLETEHEVSQWLVKLQELADSGAYMRTSGRQITWLALSQDVESLRAAVLGNQIEKVQLLKAAINRHSNVGDALEAAFSIAFSSQSGDYSGKIWLH